MDSEKITLSGRMTEKCYTCVLFIYKFRNEAVPIIPKVCKSYNISSNKIILALFFSSLSFDIVLLN